MAHPTYDHKVLNGWPKASLGRVILVEETWVMIYTILDASQGQLRMPDHLHNVYSHGLNNAWHNSPLELVFNVRATQMA